MNSATRNARAELWDKAKELPPAGEGDFFGSNRPPSGVSPEFLKIISDTSLRTRLIDSGIAQGLQSPKGPQRIPSIIRLFPNFDAPAKDASSRNGRAPQTARTAYGLPTVEELDALLARIHALEIEVSEQLASEVDAEISRLKRRIAEVDGEDFDRTFHELGRAVAKRKQLAVQVREEAFKRAESDSAFGPRKYLRLISREPKG